MDKQELIKRYEVELKDRNPFSETVSHSLMVSRFLDDLKQLDEPQKPVVPKFVADWIVQAKEDGYNIAGAINEAPKGEVDDWLELENVDIFAEAWVNGYHIEKEKRYLAKIKGAEEGYNYLNHRISSDSWFFSGESEPLDFHVKHTRKELKAGGFCEVFNSPLFEVEEVEE